MAEPYDGLNRAASSVVCWGDVVADDGFDEFFRASYAPLTRALTVATADAELAEDLVQDAFLQALRHWRRVQGYERPEAWVRRVALNKLADHGRRRGRRDRALDRLRAERVPSGDQDVGVDLVAAITALSDQQRQVVGLFYLLDLPLRDVAADLDIAEGTVKSHLAAARHALAIHLEESDDRA